MEEENITIENIFTSEEQINEIWENSNPINYVYDIIESHYQNTTGKLDYDSNMLMAISEFHVNNLIFLKETYKSFPNSIICKLLNLLNILLNLREEGGKEEADGRETNRPDFEKICQNKVRQIKQGLFTLNLVYKKPSSADSSASQTNKFYLKNEEIVGLLEYIKTFYLPFIKLYYHFINIEKITENKKIEVIINKPLPVPPLSTAVLQMQEKHQFEEQVEDKIEEHKNVSKYTNKLYFIIFRKKSRTK